MNLEVDSGQAAEKARIRRKMRLVLARLPAASMSVAAGALVARLLASEEFSRAQCIGMYAAAGWEIDLTGAVSAGLACGKSIALPRWNAADSEYEFAVIERLSQLALGQFGLREPIARCPKVEGGFLDAVFVPGLAFSRDGVRLGRGRGFYDRLLRDVRRGRCGVAYECQLLEALPAAPWDQRVEHIFTPGGRAEAQRA